MKILFLQSLFLLFGVADGGAIQWLDVTRLQYRAVAGGQFDAEAAVSADPKRDSDDK